MKEVNLVGALERGIDAMEPEHEWNEQNIHVSDLSVILEPKDRKCHRQLWYRYHGYESKKNSPGKKLMFLQGDRLHRMAAELLDKGLDEWVIACVEKDITKGLPEGFSGRLDMMMTNGKKTMIVDFKTVRGNAFNYLREPKPSHKLQVQTYMDYTCSDFGAVLYIDREGSNFARHFFVERNDEKVSKALKLARKIVSQPEPPAKMLPEIKVNNNKGNDSIKVKEPWQCAYCEYKNITCEGAIPSDYESHLDRVCGHITENGFHAKDEVAGIEKYVEPVLREKEVI